MNKVRISLSLREYTVLTRLRKITNGILEIHKVKGNIERTIVRDSNNVTDEDGIKAMREELTSIAFVGDNSIIEGGEVSLTYGEETLKS